MARDEESFCTVVSLVPRQINLEFPGLIPGRHTIDASDGIMPFTYYVGQAFHYVYLDETRGSLRVFDPPSEVARAICQDFTNGQLGLDPEGPGRPGIFWVYGKLSVPEVHEKHGDKLAEAAKQQHKWLTNLAKMADDDWNRYHHHAVVSDFQRKVAQLLGWIPDQHEWMVPEVYHQPVKCVSCGTQVRADTIVCPTCRCVLRPDEFKKLEYA